MKQKLEIKDVNAHLYGRMITMSLDYNLWGLNTHATNLRLPPFIVSTMDSDIQIMQKTLGLKISRNEYIAYALMIVLNIGFNIDTKEFFRYRNGASFPNYTTENQEKILNYIKHKIFEKMHTSANN